MLKKSLGLDVDEVILDLEDSVAPGAKVDARRNIAALLSGADTGAHTVAVRINQWSSRWASDDLDCVIAAAPSAIDCVMLPKVDDPSTIRDLAAALAQIEASRGLRVGRIGIEVQIESPRGLFAIEEIVNASARVETLVFGPGDFMAEMSLPSITVGSAAGPTQAVVDAVLIQIALAARRNGVQAIDGPYGVIADLDGLRSSAERAAAFGFDGKWVLHPSQIAPCNEAFTPSRELFDRATALLAAYGHAVSESGGLAGAVLLDGDMVDEASHKMALMVVERGRRAGFDV